MNTAQQQEAFHYFKTHAEDWRNKALGSGEFEVNVIRQRNAYVLDVIKERAATRSVLDVGCGTGDLVCAIAKEGIDATGVDFAPDMIEIAAKKAAGEGLGNANFACSSIFDFDLQARQFDAVSANGFIEYISRQQLDEFFERVHAALAPQGSFIVGSRNRLFNLFSLNDFTRMELDAAEIEPLLRESLLLASEENIDNLSNAAVAPLQKSDTEHTKTGIDVTTRFQYTPLQVIDKLRNKGFKAVEIYPIHIHCAPPVFKTKYPELHASTSNLLQAYARQCRALIPHASSFMLHALKDD
jgi:SAM-dependent methyltransferase